MTTISDLVNRSNAELGAFKREINLILDVAASEHRDNLTNQEQARVDVLFANIEAAQSENSLYKAIAREEAETDANLNGEPVPSSAGANRSASRVESAGRSS